MSEAIYYGVERAQIQITPLGDVQIDSDFSDRIANPFGASLMMRGFFQGVSAYESLYEHRNIEFSAREAFDVRFWEAWEEHFGFSVDDLRVFMDGLETEGIKRQAVTFTSTVAEMCRFEDIENLPAGVVQKIVDALVLWPRATWASTPEGFSPKDWYPWRYRRRLSVLARPILQIGGAESGYLLAPGLVRDGGAKLVDYCYMGGFEAKTFPAGRLRSWVGAAENQRGHEFNGLVARRLSELGWSCKANVRLTEILSAKLDRDYGDVDVLAWRGRRVLVIECKDLRMAMTVGDIARQLHDFREDFTSSGKPDQLKKHLLRMDVLMSRPDGVTRYVGTKERRIELEAVLVFSDLVPLHFSGIASSHSVHLVLFEQLETL